MALDPDRLPSQRLATQVRDYLLSQTDITEFFFDRIYAYKRIDQSLIALPSLNIFSDKETQGGAPLRYLDGTLQLEIMLPPSVVREGIQYESTYLTQILFLYINSRDLIAAVNPNMPGLMRVGGELKWDQAKSIGLQDTNNSDNYLVKGEIKYRINLLNYYYALQSILGKYEKTSVVVNTPLEE